MNHSNTTALMKTIAALLALTATAIAACLSILAGWQRGGLLAERVLLTCIGVVLVVAAHLLPALYRPHKWRIRATGVALWICCVAATCYGHTVFFVTAQKHAGELRAAAVPLVVAPGRNLAEIAGDRAGVVARLARVAERKCGDLCAAVRIERTTLTARLDALDAESAEVTRHEKAADRAEAERAAATADPLADSLTSFGIGSSRTDLVIGLAFAAVLEGVACFCWLLALRPAHAFTTAVTTKRELSRTLPVTSVTFASTTVAPTSKHSTGTEGKANVSSSEELDDLNHVLTAICNGCLRGTVTEIRRYLRCSQAKAAALRKRLAQHRQSGHVVTEAIADKRTS